MRHAQRLGGRDVPEYLINERTNGDVRTARASNDASDSAPDVSRCAKRGRRSPMRTALIAVHAIPCGMQSAKSRGAREDHLIGEVAVIIEDVEADFLHIDVRRHRRYLLPEVAPLKTQEAPSP